MFVRYLITIVTLFVLSKDSTNYAAAFIPRLQAPLVSSPPGSSKSFTWNNDLVHSEANKHRPCLLRTSRNTRADGDISSTTLKNSLLYSVVKDGFAKVSPSVRIAVMVGVVMLTMAKRHQILYPGTAADPNYSEPLPDGSFGCPFVGGNFVKGSKERGPGLFYKEKAAEAKNPRIFKYMMLGSPLITVTGMKNVREVFSKEFKSVVTRPSMKGFRSLFGERSLLMIQDSEDHNFLRRLVGQSMTPESISKAFPSLTQTANDQIDSLLQSSTVTMENVVTNFTLDVAWRQIIGLDLDKNEIPEFYQAVNEWIGGILNLRVMFLPGVEKTKPGKAHAYLVSMINRKIDDLEKNGPDGSTISGMLFAKDDENSKRLDRQEIIDNCLLLILAGTETSASTLTVASFLLGLHPKVFQKLRAEQHSMISKYGETISREHLEKECPYLDAVIKETMRLKPLASGGVMRTAQETLIIDGKQIPKGYGVTFNIPLTHEYDPVVREEDGSHMDVVKGFRPERWLDEATRPSEFMPFGYGPRYCLGANLALAEMKIFLALFARRVDFDLVNMKKDNITWKKSSIIAKPEDGTVIAPRAAPAFSAQTEEAFA